MGGVVPCSAREGRGVVSLVEQGVVTRCGHTRLLWGGNYFVTNNINVTLGGISLVPRPFLYGRDERGKGLVNNSTPTQIHGCISAVSVDEGKRECQVGVSYE